MNLVEHMALGGWIFMIGAWTGIIALNAFCFWKVFAGDEEAKDASGQTGGKKR